MSYGVGLRNGVAFALGTIPSLTSGGTLRPSLLLDFLSGSLDPRITFSRGTQAMRYGQDGTLQYAPNNLLTYSNQADNAAWTKSNSFVQTNLATYSQDFDLWSLGAGVTVNTNTTIAPDGTLTADRVNFATGGAPDFVRKALALTVGVTYTISVYAISTGGSPTFYFDVGNGGVVQSPNQTPTSTWQRFSYTFVFAGANQWIDIEASAPGSIVFWGGQIVQGSVPGDYRATTSAALPVLYADYNGALRARKLCEDSATGTHNIAQNATVVGGAIYTDSIYVKAGERTSCRVINYDAGTNYAWIYVDLTNGNILNSGVTGTGSNQTFTVTPAANGWYRIAIAFTLAGTSRQLRIDTAVGASENYTGNGSSGIYIADAQLTPGYLPLAVTETTSAAVYGPRFDYDPVTKVARGLLIEEQRTNLVLYSDQFDNAAWTKSLVTVTANSIAGPDGQLTADTITSSGGLSQCYQIGLVIVSGTTYTASCYMKAGTASFGVVNLYDTTALDKRVWFNLSTGTVGTQDAGITGTIQSIGNGWYRCTAIRAASAISGGVSIEVASANGVASASAGNTIYAYGAQLEAGAFATSYIPTVGSTATRNADSASITTLTPWFNAAAGTLYTESSVNGLNPAAGNAAAAFNDTTTTNFIVNRLLTTGVTPEFQVRTGGVVQAALIGGAVSATAVLKMAGAYAANDFAASMNGGTVLTDASGTIPTVTRLVIGATEFTSLANVLNGWVRSVRYYPTRLPNASLQSITV